MPEPVGVLIFAKAPVPGKVKTRLAPLLGAEGAARFYRRMAQQCLETAIAAGVGPVELWCAPDTAHPWFLSLAACYGLRLVPQRGRDLGERMRTALAVTLQRHRHAILVGTDCPALCPEDLRAARDGLDGATDAVFCPVEDGGYALVALRHAAAALFESIAWSTTEVMATTRQRLRALEWRWTELPLRWDVDQPEDLRRLRQDPRLAYLLDEVADHD
jgi:rSAM/selenodomain-associated transferase 1